MVCVPGSAWLLFIAGVLLGFFLTLAGRDLIRGDLHFGLVAANDPTAADAENTDAFVTYVAGTLWPEATARTTTTTSLRTRGFNATATVFVGIIASCAAIPFT